MITPDDTAKRKEKMLAVETQVQGFIATASPLTMLVMLKMLRLILPHQSTNVIEIEHAISKELKFS